MKKTLLLLATLWMAVACQPDDNGSKNDTRTRTLLVYMVGEDRLTSPDGAKKLNAMIEGLEPDERRSVLVYFDAMGVAPVLYELRGDLPEGKVVLESYPEQNSATKEVLNSAILAATTLRPAEEYGLLIFSHGKGWLPQGMFDNPSRTIMIDGGSEMEVEELAAAIPDHLFEYIAFETCHSMSIEMLWLLRNKAEKILGSSAEILSPGYEFAYARAVDRLAEGNVEAFAGEVFKDFNSDYYFYSGTLSIVNTAALEPLRAFIAANCDLAKPVNIAALQRFGRTVGSIRAHNLFFDFEEYYAALLDTDAEREQLHRLVASAVPWRKATAKFDLGDGNAFTIVRHSGMTTYAPQTAYPKVDSAWWACGWVQACGWGWVGPNR